MSLRKNCFSWILTATLLLGASLPAFAVEKKKDGAKGLFFEQLESPSKDLNTGIQYWIELERDGKKIRTNNKTEFRSGDRIRFRVKSNIKGYAYILLTTGSRGEQSVLFPDPSVDESNKVLPGKVYTLPGMGALTFDENPGMEKVTLLLSRHPIDAQAYLNKPTEQPTLIASAMTGSKDLVPAKVLVSYRDPNKSFPSSSLKVSRSNASSSSDSGSEEKPKAKPKAKQKQTQIASKPKSKAKPKTSSKSKPKTQSKKTQVASAEKKENKVYKARAVKHETETVTVVSQATGGVLHVDVSLHHI